MLQYVYFAFFLLKNIRFLGTNINADKTSNPSNVVKRLDAKKLVSINKVHDLLIATNDKY